MAAKRIEVNNSVDLIGQFSQALNPVRPWDSIVDFAMHPSFCGYKPYPRQLTLLKLIYLETENMTAYDIDVIEGWRKGFGGKESIGVPPDVWDRVKYLKDNGYRRFTHVLSVLGRRASKGWTGGIIGAETLAYMHALDDWQDFYGIQSHKDGYMNCLATNFQQAQKFQFADVREAVRQCKYLQPWIVVDKNDKLAIQTPADKRYQNELLGRKHRLEQEIATLNVVAMTSNSASGRGATAFANFYDEFAHMVVGTGGPRTSEEVYCLDPSTRVLRSDLTWQPIGEIEEGTELIGIDEDVPQNGPGSPRRLRRSTVKHVWKTSGKALRIHFEDGTSVTCSMNHRWLSSKHKPGSPSSSGGLKWVAADQLTVGQAIRYVVEPWHSEDSFDGGYISGIFDGEGTLNADVGRRVSFNQKPGKVLDKAKSILSKFGVKFSTRKESGGNTHIVEVNGLPETLSLLGRFRPVRLLSKASSLWEDRTITGGELKRIASIDELPEQELIDMETSTGTFIAEGLISHNSAYQPSLMQFGKDQLTYIPSSPYSKVGQFYNLYTQGSAQISAYREKHGGMLLGDTGDEVDVPTMLVVQLPSWELYRDFDRAEELIGVAKKSAFVVKDSPEMKLEKKLNKSKFRVEYNAQFAEVEDAYLDSDKVDGIFAPWKGQTLERRPHGFSDRIYHAHADPARTNANFAFAITHLEDAEPVDRNGNPDPNGEVWPHVVVDVLHVWKAEDFPDNTIHYPTVEKELGEILDKYPSLVDFSFDQWNSAGMIDSLRLKYGDRTRFHEVTFTKKENFSRFEKFKSAVNLGWIHSYYDNLFDSDAKVSLLEQELKFLTEKNGEVVKQDFGPVTTKDLSDCVMTTAVRLLDQSLSMWRGRMGLDPVMSTLNTTRAVDNISKASTLRDRLDSFGTRGYGAARSMNQSSSRSSFRR